MDATWDPEEELLNLKLELEIEGMTPEQLADRLLKDAAPRAAQSIIWLSQHSQNESNRFKASSYILDQVLGKAKPGSDLKSASQQFKELIDGLV